MSKAQDKRDAREAARTHLRDIIDRASATPNYRPARLERARPIVYVNVTSVSASGMSRRMCVYVILPSNYATCGELVNITADIATACDLPINDHGVRVDGGGMDMRFHLIDTMAHAIGRGDGNDYDRRSL